MDCLGLDLFGSTGFRRFPVWQVLGKMLAWLFLLRSSAGFEAGFDRFAALMGLLVLMVSLDILVCFCPLVLLAFVVFQWYIVFKVLLMFVVLKVLPVLF